jgi:hypothetical protein
MRMILEQMQSDPQVSFARRNKYRNPCWVVLPLFSVEDIKKDGVPDVESGPFFLIRPLEAVIIFFKYGNQPLRKKSTEVLCYKKRHRSFLFFLMLLIIMIPSRSQIQNWPLGSIFSGKGLD